ncbi:AMP-binding protein [Actinomarinicola tropica]|uniref:AMP-binding protein n=1 Tax=Actinomarinicola tropica TaxID=2789776 RepID=A0A5Q2RJM2_9ACTN|nr:AMP-binding protein [Actinomarinicola tropica]
MIYTSGTTGKPKGVRRAPFTPEQATALAEINEQVLGIVPRMRTLIPAPMYHSGPVPSSTSVRASAPTWSAGRPRSGGARS